MNQLCTDQNCVRHLRIHKPNSLTNSTNKNPAINTTKKKNVVTNNNEKIKVNVQLPTSAAA